MADDADKPPTVPGTTLAAHSREAPSTSPSPSATADAGAAKSLANVTSASTKANASQPMTSTSSSSSNPSIKDATTSGTPSASPYGTRSRNRATASRPNYAEDKESEMDYEYTSKAAPTTDSQATDLGRLSGVSTRRASAVANGATTMATTNSSGSASSKDHIPGTSSFSANPTNAGSSQSRKRKAAGSVNAAPSPNGPTAAGHAMARKASTAAASAGGARESNMLTFENCQGYLKGGKLKADDGTVLAVNDHVYLICEPPGEPYYLARIMEFLHIENEQNLPIDSLRVNWYYRPRDIQRKVNDTRVVFSSMHSDTCPLASLRGKCQIQHRSEIEEIDDYRKIKDRFWYEKMFDRYIHRYYEVIPTSQVINVPGRVKKVLDERWKFVIVEIGRGKELTSDVKSCKRCAGYAATPDSVECAVCNSTYHMNCVRPPLLKKPSRGFAWACAPCSRARERKLEARNTPLVGELTADPDEEELYDEDEEDALSPEGTGGGTSSSRSQEHDPIHPATAEQIAHAKLWPYRYLGIHCKVEDALDYDDRIYPRASSRLGPRHQANVNVWHGHPVELVKPADIKRKYVKGGSHKKDTKPSKETLAALEAEKIAKEKRPKWVMDEPTGYVHRGEDHNNRDPENTAQLIFRIPKVGELAELSRSRSISGDTEIKQEIENREQIVDEYMTRAKGLSKIIGVEDYSTNFLDKALEILCKNNFDSELSLKQLRAVHKRKDLKEPELKPDEVKRFEEGVSKYGSELHNVTKYVKTQKEADIVRFYYMWKKTEKGRKIWGNYEGRKGKKEAKRADHNAGKLVDDVADDHDDSAFDGGKAADKKKGFECKFCSTRSSTQWRRAPGVAPGTTILADANGKGGNKDKGAQLIVALCRRCAELWRRYGIPWEDVDEVAKKVAQGGGRAWKRRIDEELLKELVAANEAAAAGTNSLAVAAAAGAAGGTPVPTSLTLQSSQEPPKKKLKTTQESIASQSPSNGTVGTPAAPSGQKKKVVEKSVLQPAPPEIPKPKLLPCAICKRMEPTGDQHLSCRECRMSVHRDCYGVGEARSANKWVCDMCSNDKNPQVSTLYECVLCPVDFTEHEFVDPPKISHKKKTDKEREKERTERDNAIAAAEYYRKRQEDMNRPINPREPLKRTAGNNWVHVICAVWAPEIKFGNAKALEPCEGIGNIAASRYQQVCKIFHVTCAHKAGYIIGFDITPIKGSRRDHINTVTLGNETGSMTPVVWCKDHTVKTIVHQINEMVDGTGPNALQLYVRNYKQADLTLTGTVRKANLINPPTKAVTQSSTGTSGNRRASAGTTLSGAAAVTSPQSIDGSGVTHTSDNPEAPSKKFCVVCGIDVSPKWWKVPSKAPPLQVSQGKISSGHPPQPVQGSPNGAMVNGDNPHDVSHTEHHAPSQQSQSPPQRGGSGATANGEVMNNPAAIAAAALTVDTVIPQTEKLETARFVAPTFHNQPIASTVSSNATACSSFPPS
ncbi:MAG: putative PHD type zinc finger protein with BAH domain-containing protein [Geoglossum simile]|nr:MAG: putative PHD type zinc finger protein with BAH domain-containing protein [Geoglossum simile]